MPRQPTLKPIADAIRKVPPVGLPEREGQHDSDDGKRRRSVVRLIHPKAELIPVSNDAGARGISRRSGFVGTWTDRYRWPPISPPTALCHEKSDRDVAEWRPSPTVGWFAAKVVAVKQKYDLSVNPAERDALASMLASDSSRTVTCN